MITKTLQNLWDGARAAVDLDVATDRISDTILTDWANEDIRELWSILTPICRDEFTSLSSTITIVAPNSTASIVATAADFLGVRGVDRDVGGGNWKKLKPWRIPARSSIGQISYHITGTTLRIEPAVLAPGLYRLWYVAKPSTLLVGTPAGTIDLPLGGDKYVIQGMAARMRAREEEDPAPHLKLQEAALVICKRYMTSHNQGDQEAIIDVADGYEPNDIGEW